MGRTKPAQKKEEKKTQTENLRAQPDSTHTHTKLMSLGIAQKNQTTHNVVDDDESERKKTRISETVNEENLTILCRSHEPIGPQPIHNVLHIIRCTQHLPEHNNRFRRRKKTPATYIH